MNTLFTYFFYWSVSHRGFFNGPYDPEHRNPETRNLRFRVMAVEQGGFAFGTPQPLWTDLVTEARKIIDARNSILAGLERAQSIEKRIRALVDQHFVLVGEWAYAPNTAFWPTRQHYERLAHQLRNEDLAVLPQPWEEISHS